MKTKMKYKVTYIDYKGERVTRLCHRVYHYKKYAKVEFIDEYDGKPMYMYEDVEYKNIINEEAIK